MRGMDKLLLLQRGFDSSSLRSILVSHREVVAQVAVGFIRCRSNLGFARMGKGGILVEQSQFPDWTSLRELHTIQMLRACFPGMADQCFSNQGLRSKNCRRRIQSAQVGRKTSYWFSGVNREGEAFIDPRASGHDDTCSTFNGASFVC